MDYLAGIDLGSTSLKCVIYDLAATLLPVAHVQPNAITLIRTTRNGQYGSPSKFGAGQPQLCRKRSPNWTTHAISRQ